MNRFILDQNPLKAAEYHCDKHVVKMILEEAQMLSTVHRIIDGDEYVDASSGRKIKRWRLNDDRELSLYKATHVGHPCTQWAMQSSDNYVWALMLFRALLNEYRHRYNKVHKCEMLWKTLSHKPNGMKNGPVYQFPQAMPDDCKQNDPVEGYRKYYIDHKARFAKWTNREKPEWFIDPAISN
jgi:hypothetical protein